MQTALLFPGQGSQYIGMGQELFTSSLLARRTFEEASEILGNSVSKLCFQGDLAELTRTEYAQPCILTVGIAAFRVLMEKTELNPVYLAGHSLGEITALTASGALHFADAIRLVRLRGMLMRDAQMQRAGSMLAVHGLSSQVIEKECREPEFRGQVVISNLNSSRQTVVSGYMDALSMIQNRFVALGGYVTPLQVGGAFHSPLMKDAAMKLYDELSCMRFHPMRYSVLSNVTALPYPSETCIPSFLSEQMVEKVHWQGCVQFLMERQINNLIEVGPGSVLSNMLRRERPESCLIHPTDKKEDWQKLMKDRAPKGTENAPYARYLKAALCARNHNIHVETSDYLEEVAGSFRELERLAKSEEFAGGNDKALKALKHILDCKMTPAPQRGDILSHIAEEGVVQHV
ncbi:ACP S-malonyltransferase [Paenibacillus pabuli]|nr:ACP S-malonyltransferase [Paenibacillus pabuli]MEC0128817.1 ACP S-malonyltransferase [Paenibacillus pabuli]